MNDMSEIKPKFVDGEARCSRDCPSFVPRDWATTTRDNSYCRIGPRDGMRCWSYYRAALAESQAENVQLSKGWSDEIDKREAAVDKYLSGASVQADRADRAESALAAAQEILSTIKAWAETTIEEYGEKLAAAQAECERLANRLEVRLEAGKLYDKMSQGDMRSLVDEVNTERTRAESAESRVAKLEEVMEGFRGWREPLGDVNGPMSIPTEYMRLFDGILFKVRALLASRESEGS